MGAAHQPSLLGLGTPRFDDDFARLTRIDLGRGAWVDRAAGWLEGHEQLFETLLATTAWREVEREMYDRVVAVPRLLASLPDDGPGHPVLREIAKALGRRYRVRFDALHLAHYRDGRDSVAWHGDKVRRTERNVHVAIVSLGTPRRFLLRPTGGGRLRTFTVGWGDLVVMGGTCQTTFEHCVPKCAKAGPRMAVMFRSRRDLDPPRFSRSTGGGLVVSER